MTNFVFLTDSVITQTLSSDHLGKTAEDARAELEASSGKTVLITDDPLAVCGAVWDGENFTIPEPPAPEPVTRLTKLEYMNRFEDAELAAIYTAAKSVIQIEIWLEKFKLATEIDLADPRTIGGVQALEAAGLIGPGRAAEILAP